MSSSADKVNDLQPVTITELRLGPLGLRHDFAVQLDRNPISLHAEMVNEFSQRNGFGVVLAFAINE